jgi:hypothetical protein
MFTFTNDEGIYLEGARSLFEGKVLYKDHFAFTGPGTYWILAACFQLFGFTVAAGRIPFVVDLAVTTAFTYWFVARFITKRSAVAAAFVCFVVQIANPNMQNTNHRWDSGALACIALAAACWRSGGRVAPFVSGVSAAAAAWCSPPVVFLGGVLAVWHWRRSALLWYLAGGAACSAISVAILAISGSLPYLLPSLLWASRNYSEANRVPYGFVNGGFANVFAGGSPTFAVIAAIVLTAILLPAICPVVNLLGIRRILRGPAEIGLLMAGSMALVVSTYPRVDTGHLTNVLAPALAVSVWVIAGWRAAKFMAVVVGIAAAMLFYYTVETSFKLERRDTRAGAIRGQAREVDAIAFAQSSVPAGATLFVYPYMPMMYFATGGVNPTQYSFLQPGMMTSADETIVLKRLNQNPPEYVLFALFSAEDLLRIWPNSDLKRLRMSSLEQWIQLNYTADTSGRHINSYKLYRRNSSL